MSTFVFQMINTFIIFAFIIGIPLFMFIVLKSLKRIEDRLENLETNFGSKEEAYCMKLAHQLRKEGVNCDIYPKAAKLNKQMKYANDTKVQYTALIGEQEIQENTITLKNMITGEQSNVTLSELIEKLK